MKRLIASIIVVAMVAPAAADPRKVMVLPSDGRADAKVRLKIDAAMLKLAKTLPDTVTPGEVSYNDLAAAMGCKPEESVCKDEVLGTLAVDEIVTTTVTPKGTGLEIATHRVTRGGASKDATITVPGDKPEGLEQLAPLFGGVAPKTGNTPPPLTNPTNTSTNTPPPLNPSNPTNPTTNPTNPSISTTTDPSAGIEQPPVEQPVQPPVAPVESRPAPVPVGPRDDHRRGSRKLEIAGMAVGGGLVLVGFGFWGQASDLQNQINTAPVKNKNDLRALQDLETRGDSAANTGNLLVIAGLVVGGVSTYYFLKRRRHASTTAMLAPTVFDHGAGLVFVGGVP